jgi:hypothetical protein
LRVKNGPCAPLRFISMLSRPATGTTRSSVTTGVAFAWTEFDDMVRYLKKAPASALEKRFENRRRGLRAATRS